MNNFFCLFQIETISLSQQTLFLLFAETTFLPESESSQNYCLLVVQITGGEAVTSGAWGDVTDGDEALKNGGESGGIGRWCQMYDRLSYQGSSGEGLM